MNAPPPHAPPPHASLPGLVARIAPRSPAETAVGQRIDRELPALLARLVATPAGQAAARLVARDPERWVLLLGDARFVRRCTPDELPDGESIAVAYRSAALAVLHQERRLATATRCQRWRRLSDRRIQIVAILPEWSDATDVILAPAPVEVAR